MNINFRESRKSNFNRGILHRMMLAVVFERFVVKQTTGIVVGNVRLG
jgi:hypothetical protein